MRNALWWANRSVKKQCRETQHFFEQVTAEPQIYGCIERRNCFTAECSKAGGLRRGICILDRMWLVRDKQLRGSFEQNEIFLFRHQ